MSPMIDDYVLYVNTRERIRTKWLLAAIWHAIKPICNRDYIKIMKGNKLILIGEFH
jgi:hypothetical protein